MATIASISGVTRVYAIIGHPIAQVQSPEYFNAFFAEAGIDAVLVPMHIHPQDAAASIAALMRMPNLHGLIATVPHKAALLAAVDQRTDRAKLCNGANVARPDAKGGWRGDMLDGLGFINGLRAHGHDPKDAVVHMAGAGGVGSAIAVALAEAGIASLTMWDIDWYRAQSLGTVLGNRFPRLHLRPERGNVAQASIVINATPMGMKPDDAMPIDVDTLRPETVACDVISKPVMSRFLQAAQAKGCPIITGKDLFDGQVAAMKSFFGWG